MRIYLAIEEEALDTAWTIEKLHHFLYALCFTCETDHKPLEIIMNHSVKEASPRIQGIIIHCLPYDFTKIYI